MTLIMVVVRTVRVMASFAAQAALRSRWSSLIESTSVDVPGEVTDGVRSVVGWLKQALSIVILGSLLTALCTYFA